MTKMKTTEFKDRILNGDMDRRMFNKALAAVGLATVMQPMMSGNAKAAGDVNYFTWSGYDDPAFFQAYMAKYGGEPDYSFFGSEDEGLAKVRAGFKPTVGHPCSDTVSRWARAGITKGIDTSRLSNYGGLYPELANLPGNSHNGEKVFVPFDWGNSSVIFRTDLVDPKYVEEHSWEILFDERYAGRLATYNAAGGATAVAGLVLGHPTESLFAPNDDQLAAIREKLAQQQPLIR
ncbi:MAG: ABC transporter, partial [Rhodospirillales bacterium]|nr:ABC transporter [Rhodospirillales bacterium]